MMGDLSVWGPAGTIVTAMAAVCVFLYRELKSERQRNDTLQSDRLQDARETRDKITAPMEAMAKTTDKMYDILLSINRGK